MWRFAIQNLISRPVRSLLALAGLSVAGAASAQQFQYQPGMIPGTPRWSEGVEACAVDLDGDLDLFFAAGDGFSGSPGHPAGDVRGA